MWSLWYAHSLRGRLTDAGARREVSTPAFDGSKAPAANRRHSASQSAITPSGGKIPLMRTPLQRRLEPAREADRPGADPPVARSCQVLSAIRRIQLPSGFRRGFGRGLLEAGSSHMHSVLYMSKSYLRMYMYACTRKVYVYVCMRACMHVCSPPDQKTDDP